MVPMLHMLWAVPVDVQNLINGAFLLLKGTYKGIFNSYWSRVEASKFDPQNTILMYEVTAYSTLGWFNDPILSSMMSYSDYDLVNTIIHETVHATIFIKNQADFNERLATFVWDLGAQLFFQKRV